jgi:hypothetical protein
MSFLYDVTRWFWFCPTKFIRLELFILVVWINLKFIAKTTRISECSGANVRDIPNRYTNHMEIFYQTRMAHWWYSHQAYHGTRLLRPKRKHAELRKAQAIVLLRPISYKPWSTRQQSQNFVWRNTWMYWNKRKISTMLDIRKYYYETTYKIVHRKRFIWQTILWSQQTEKKSNSNEILGTKIIRTRLQWLREAMPLGQSHHPEPFISDPTY